MDDSLKYLIHARIVADGVVERTDVVGAVFGQTDGLLGDELDIRNLQESAKLGRIDVEIETENGQSFGTLTVGCALDKVETAILAAGLETIDRVGPCVADIEVTKIEDVRAAKRREVVERAKELLVSGFDDASLTSTEIIEEVRQTTRPGKVTEYAGLPAGPGVESGDAIILVEGRADVRRLVEAGITNVVAIEGTNVPDDIVELSEERMTTAFLDGDRGGDLILQELAQVAAIDQVARAPRNRSVEDLSRQELTTALREKEPLDAALARIDPDHRDSHATRPDGSTTTETASDLSIDTHPTEIQPSDPVPTDEPVDDDASSGPTPTEDIDDSTESAVDNAPTDDQADVSEADTTSTDVPTHANDVIGASTDEIRVLAPDLSILTEAAAADAHTVLEELTDDPAVVVIDDTCGQPLVDVAAETGVDRIVARDRGDFVKQPAAVRVHTLEEVQESTIPPDSEN